MSSNVNVLKKSKISLRYLVQIGMLAAVGVILMIFEIPLGFLPPFYKIDLAEVPIIIGTFAMGPLAGVLIEFVKILLNFVLDGTTTFGIGELSNFLIGCALIIPAGIIYKRNKSRKSAIVGLIVGVLSMCVIGGLLNAFVILPVYAVVYGMPLAGLVAMGSEVNKLITNLPTFILFAVVPFNLLKGAVVSVVCIILYKYVSPILKRHDQ